MPDLAKDLEPFKTVEEDLRLAHNEAVAEADRLKEQDVAGWHSARARAYAYDIAANRIATALQSSS